jgi:hypothetical protein
MADQMEGIVTEHDKLSTQLEVFQSKFLAL